jgi:hypothetical protein
MQRILLTVLLGLLPLTAAADGRFYPPTAFPAQVTIPDQRALIHFTNGMERLVIETRFTGAGTNFAWVVPLPSQPVVEAASAGLFPTLNYYFQPEITHHVPRYYLGILGAIGLLLLLRFLVCHCSSPISGVMIFLLLLLGAALLLPALGTARSRSAGMADSSVPSVSILDRQLVGVFETTTIAARDPQALQTWLRENGFTVTTNSEPVIADYVKDGWVFVAAKVRRDQAGNQTSTPHPLSFTFKTERPVYPMRLTGVDNGPLLVELYVFADQRAHAQHFKVERCTRPGYPAGDGKYMPRVETVNIMHPQLRSWVGGSPVATKLTATLSPGQMRRDVWLDRRGFWETKSRRFSHAGAATIALNWSTCILAVGLMAAYVFAFAVRPGNPKFSTPIQLALAISLLVGGLIYMMLPKIEVRLVRRFFGETRNAQYYPMLLVEDATLDEARRMLANPTKSVTKQIWERHFQAGNWPNHYLGGQIHEEDSPGNFILREENGYVQYVIFDAQGAEQVLQTWLPAQPK